MAEFNQFQLYCAIQSGNDALRDDCSLIKQRVDSMKEYAEVRTFVESYFKNVKQAGDIEVKQFDNTNKHVLCQMFDDETIFFLIKSSKSTEPEWTHLAIKQ